MLISTGLSSSYFITKVYGIATDTSSNYKLPLPFLHRDDLTSCISMTINPDNDLRIGTEMDRRNVKAYVVIEYTK